MTLGIEYTCASVAVAPSRMEWSERSQRRLSFLRPQGQQTRAHYTHSTGHDEGNENRVVAMVVQEVPDQFFLEDGSNGTQTIDDAGRHDSTLPTSNINGAHTR
jgi:hypothetical protein